MLLLHHFDAKVYKRCFIFAGGAVHPSHDLTYAAAAEAAWCQSLQKVTLLYTNHLERLLCCSKPFRFHQNRGKNLPQRHFDANLCKSRPLLIVCRPIWPWLKIYSCVKNNWWNQCVAMHIITEMQQLRKVRDWDGPNIRSLQKHFCTNLIIDLIHNSPLYSYRMDFPIPNT